MYSLIQIEDLRRACYHEDLKLVREILESCDKLNPTLVDREGDTVMHQVCRQGSLNLLRLLAEFCSPQHFAKMTNDTNNNGEQSLLRNNQISVLNQLFKFCGLNVYSSFLSIHVNI